MPEVDSWTLRLLTLLESILELDVRVLRSSEVESLFKQSWYKRQSEAFETKLNSPPW